MRTPVGPSLQVVLALSQVAGDLAVAGVVAAWERWVGPQRFARKLLQLERDGLVRRGRGVGDEAQQVVTLTDAGRLAAIGGRDPDERWGRAWDGRWRLVLFDVSESRRSLRIHMQRQLKRLHFGYLQDSVWVTPDSSAELRSSLARASIDAAVLTMIDGRPCGGETDADMVEGGWDFARINRAYEDHLKIVQAYAGIVSDRARRNWLQTEWRAWQRAVALDPMLPSALLPRGYRGGDAWSARRERLSEILRKG